MTVTTKNPKSIPEISVKPGDSQSADGTSRTLRLSDTNLGAGMHHLSPSSDSLSARDGVDPLLEAQNRPTLLKALDLAADTYRPMSVPALNFDAHTAQSSHYENLIIPVERNRFAVLPKDLTSKTGTGALDLAIGGRKILTYPLPQALRADWRAGSTQSEKAGAHEAALSSLKNSTTRDILKDEQGLTYHLGPIFAGGSYGAIRLMLQEGPVVNKVYIGKELRRAHAGNDQGQLVLGASAAMKPSHEFAVRDEVQIALMLRSPIAPHKILRTHDRDFLLLPQMDGSVDQILPALAHAFDLLPSKAATAQQLASPKAMHLFRQQMISDRIENTVRENINAELSSEAYLIGAHRTITFALADQGARDLANLHELGFVHLDIKPENFLFDRTGAIVLSDMGMARPVALADLEDHQIADGTLNFIPFEGLLTNIRDRNYSPVKHDIWSLGASIMDAAIGYTPIDLLAAELKDQSKTSAGAQAVILSHFESYDKAWSFFNAEYQADPNLRYLIGSQPGTDTDYHHMLSASWYIVGDRFFGDLLKMVAPYPEERYDSVEDIVHDLSLHAGADQDAAQKDLSSWFKKYDGRLLPRLSRKEWGVSPSEPQES